MNNHPDDLTANWPGLACRIWTPAFIFDAWNLLDPVVFHAGPGGRHAAIETPFRDA